MFVIFLHFFTLHSTLQQMDFVHLSALENRMGDSKSDPFSLGKIIRHTFALHAARKMKKCDHFGGSSTPFPPRINVGSCDDDRIYASVST